MFKEWSTNIGTADAFSNLTSSETPRRTLVTNAGRKQLIHDVRVRYTEDQLEDAYPWQKTRFPKHTVIGRAFQLSDRTEVGRVIGQPRQRALLIQGILTGNQVVGLVLA